MPLQVRATPELLARLDALAAEIVALDHPIALTLAEARGRRVLTRTDVIRLCLARGERALREELDKLREGAAP
jgi:hypothetical protein